MTWLWNVGFRGFCGRRGWMLLLHHVGALLGPGEGERRVARPLAVESHVRVHIHRNGSGLHHQYWANWKTNILRLIKRCIYRVLLLSIWLNTETDQILTSSKTMCGCLWLDQMLPQQATLMSQPVIYKRVVSGPIQLVVFFSLGQFNQNGVSTWLHFTRVDI